MGERDKPGQEEPLRPLFDLGQIVGTPGAMAALDEARQDALDFIFRHVTGDWGELPEEDIQENEFSVAKGFRVFSKYQLETGVNIYVITEYDRSVTTVLLPMEY